MTPATAVGSVRERTALLLEARRAVSTSLDLETALTAFAQQMVPGLADWGAVDVLEDEGTLHRVAVAHADPARLPLLQSLRRRYRLDPDAPGWPARAIRTGQTQFARDADDPGLVALVGDAEHLDAVLTLGARSVVCAPLLDNDRVVGALTLVRIDHRVTFTASDAAAARYLGTVAGTAIAHCRRYAEAQTANRAKDEFMAMLGHELRNPIGAILNAVSVLERLGTPEEPAARVRAIIARQARHLARLVDDLLDLARLSSGKVTIRRRPVDLREIAERCLATLRVAGSTERHDVVLEVEPATVAGDRTRLEQVLGNLLDNALKFTPAGGRITVTVRRDGPVALLRVEDAGMGIAPEVLPRVFDLFAQGPQPASRERGGLGLGLTVVRRLVELHGGSVEAASAGLGRGTAVTVYLPLHREPAAVAPADAATAPGRAPQRILIVEDNADARDALRQLLELDGHEVLIAEDGRRAVEVALATRPDVMLVDIGLPGTDGYEVARQVRAAPGARDIRLVALTGYGQPADRVRTQEAGFDAHLVKPVDSDELSRILASAGEAPFHDA